MRLLKPYLGALSARFVERTLHSGLTWIRDLILHEFKSSIGMLLG